MDAQRAFAVGRAGGTVDGAAAGAHEHGGGERPGAEDGPGTGMRQAEQGGHRGQLRRDDGQARGRYARQGRGRRRTRGLVATHIDSWENGAQNWTAKMREEFQKRRGYDLFPFLPVITGRVVDSAEVSERFLWDLRQTISDLVVENYAGHMRELANAAGLRFTVEAYGAPCDSIPYGGASDEPMGEFWSPSGAMETCRGMASAGHVYGQADHRRGILHRRRPGEVAGAPRLAQGAGRHGVLRRHQPVCVSPLRAAALGRRPASRHDDGALGPALRTHGNVVGAVRRVASLPGPLPVPVAAGAVRRGHLLPATGTAAAVLRGSPAPGLRLRRMRCESGAEPHVGEERPDHAARRDELPAAGPAPNRADDAAAVAQDQGPGAGRGDDRRHAAAEVAQPLGVS